MVFAQETVARVRCQNERASKVKCGGGTGVGEHKKWPVTDATDATHPTLISSHSEIPTSDTGDVATPYTSGVAAVCFVWEGSREGIGAGEEEAIYFMGGVVNVVT